MQCWCWIIKSYHNDIWYTHSYPKFQMGDLSLLDAVESEVFSLSSADSWLTWCWYDLLLMSLLMLMLIIACVFVLFTCFLSFELINFTHHDNSSCPRLEWSSPLCLVLSTTLLKRSLLENYKWLALIGVGETGFPPPLKLRKVAFFLCYHRW